MTITEFLLARIAEDEREAERAGSFTPWTDVFQRDNYGHLTIQPSRVLTECEAKREIVELAQSMNSQHRQLTLAALASVYADHPDYREEWRL